VNGPLPSVAEAVRLLNRQAFFECHEVLEDLWRPLPPGPEKRFLQGVIQVDVGFHHLVNGNEAGAKSLLRSGLDKLTDTPVPWSAQGYDWPRFIRHVQDTLAGLSRPPEERPDWRPPRL
jgi:predicted metal-dependent hydrolase